MAAPVGYAAPFTVTKLNVGDVALVSRVVWLLLREELPTPTGLVVTVAGVLSWALVVDSLKLVTVTVSLDVIGLAVVDCAVGCPSVVVMVVNVAPPAVTVCPGISVTVVVRVWGSVTVSVVFGPAWTEMTVSVVMIVPHWLLG